MARNGVVSWPRRLEKMDGFDLSGSDSDGVHVLAVDDSIIDRKLIEALLKSSSCKVTAVDSGRRALQFLGLDEEQSSDGLDGLKVDMIITDYCMPGMTGYELLKKIKESSTFREIPVVIMSSENVLTRIDRCLEEGAEDFIMKPVKLTDVKRLKNYMSRVVGVGNKRKFQDTCDGDHRRHHSLSASPPSNSSSPLSSPSDSSPSLNSTPPSSPTTAAVESPVRRLKMTSCD